MENRILKERFDLEIIRTLDQVKKTFSIDRSAKEVIGMFMTSNRDDLLFYRGSQKIELSDQVLFPESFESRLLMSSLSVSPNDRWYSMCEQPRNYEVTIDYKDSHNSLTIFTPYRVSLYVISKI